MVNFIRTNPLINQFVAFYKQSLVTNAGYLMGISIVNAFVGFLFWGSAAHLYSPENVGFSSAMISAALLACGLTDFGMSIGLIRFLPETQTPFKFLNTIFTFEVVTSVFAGVLYLAGISVWSPALASVRNNKIHVACFLCFVIFFTLGSLANRAFIARRKSLYALFFNFISNGGRLIFVILLVSFGSTGIFGSLTIAFVLATSVSFFYLLPKIEPGYRLRPTLDWSVLRTILPYSLGNFIVGLLFMISQRFLPLLVIEKLGPASSGHFYIAWMIGEFLASPTTALSDATFAEGSNSPERLNTHLLRSAKIGLGITVPAAVIIFIGSPFILNLFGTTYAEEATSLLKWMAIAAPLSIIAGLFITSLRVRKRTKQLILVGAIPATITLGFSYGQISNLGITAVGIGWFIGMSLTALMAIIGFVVHKRIITYFLDHYQRKGAKLIGKSKEV
ncbi:MAG TPA: lipopolysaccharide biosynthesis protein [Anaerolineales bacterium]|jgi:O-antigen/teichoic acid export membrane protein